MFTFDNSESIDRIYGIKTIAYQVVKIETIQPELCNVRTVKVIIMFVSVVTKEFDVSNVLVNALQRYALDPKTHSHYVLLW